jgi:hypothetical protein
MSTRWSVAVAVVVASLLGLSEAAHGQTVETVIPDFIVSCTSTGELCDPPWLVSVQTGSVLQVQYFVRPTHCASVRVGLLVDGTLKATSDFLGWPGAPAPFSDLALDTGLVDLGPVSPGAHVVGVQAEGQVSGCNVGQLDDWGGSLKVLTSPLVATAPIDIKPGSFPNSINPRSRGKIPVAILTTDTFDATTVRPTTVRFGPTGTEVAPVHPALEDVDGDGDIDLILHFNTRATGIKCGDVSVLLTGKTFGGQPIQGSDSIRTVGCK